MGLMSPLKQPGQSHTLAIPCQPPPHRVIACSHYKLDGYNLYDASAKATLVIEIGEPQETVYMVYTYGA